MSCHVRQSLRLGRGVGFLLLSLLPKPQFRGIDGVTYMLAAEVEEESVATRTVCEMYPAFEWRLMSANPQRDPFAMRIAQQLLNDV